MKIKYFEDSDTLLIIFNNKKIVDTKDINENLLVELDEQGDIVSLTLEHAKKNANIFDFSYQQIATA